MQSELHVHEEIGPAKVSEHVNFNMKRSGVEKYVDLASSSLQYPSTQKYLG